MRVVGLPRCAARAAETTCVVLLRLHPSRLQGEDTDFGWFNNNGLLVRPNEPVTVTYTPRAGPAALGPASRSHTPCTATATGAKATSGFYAVSVNGISK